MKTKTHFRLCDGCNVKRLAVLPNRETEPCKLCATLEKIDTKRRELALRSIWIDREEKATYQKPKVIHSKRIIYRKAILPDDILRENKDDSFAEWYHYGSTYAFTDTIQKTSRKLA